MAIFRLNHAVLYVRDLTESVAFYTDVLRFRRIDEMTPDGFAGAAFLRAPDSTNDHDLGLFELGPAAGPSLAGRQPVGLYHLAWEVDTLDELEATAQRLAAAGALDQARDSRKRIAPLDLTKEKERYGASTRGGVGISTPA
jgi:catechol 2,3-dioxygenase-like lactoylglutathione lyase family enzyme